MSDPVFPFEPDVDPEAERAALGPLDRRDLVVTLLIAVAAALFTGTAGLVAAIELRIAPDALFAVILTGIGPFVSWIAGATLAFVRLVRRRRRAWLPMLVATGAALVCGAIGVVVWLAASGLL